MGSMLPKAKLGSREVEAACQGCLPITLAALAILAELAVLA
jgi:hypothetical protein